MQGRFILAAAELVLATQRHGETALRIAASGLLMRLLAIYVSRLLPVVGCARRSRHLFLDIVGMPRCITDRRLAVAAAAVFLCQQLQPGAGRQTHWHLSLNSISGLRNIEYAQHNKRRHPALDKWCRSGLSACVQCKCLVSQLKLWLLCLTRDALTDKSTG